MFSDATKRGKAATGTGVLAAHENSFSRDYTCSYVTPALATASTKTFLMVFAKRLREGVRRGEITCSVRIWRYPHVKVGHRYRMEEGEIEVDSIEPIGFPDITPALARESGFLGIVDLLKVAKHGKGENIYLIRFRYLPPRAQRLGPRKSS
jgi:hypothetical protein